MAKMIQCKTCGADMASNAKVCPKCGAKNKKTIFKRWWFYVLIVVFIIIIIPKGSSNSNSDADSSNSTSVAKSPSKSDNALADDIIDVDINKCHVKYLRHEIVENMAGAKCVAVYYEFTNNSDDNKAFYVTIADKAFQDGVELESSLFHVSDESHDSSAEIRPGVTITVCEAYVLRNEESDVELEVREWISLKDDPTDKMLVSIK